MATTRILLVEDEWLIRSTVSDELREEGYSVVEAGSGDEAAKVLDHQAFDLLLTDVRMPGRLDGIDLAAYARQQNPALPVLVVSGYAAQINTRVAALSGPTTLIPKPYAIDQIIRELRRLIPAG